MPAAAAPPDPSAARHRPGLLVLHGNRLEDLATVLMTWLAQHPLPPLALEHWLVPSNGMAEWLKMELAARQGVCAAAQVELPARFLWRAYRAVLGPAAVPAQSPLDKLPLTWRLMRLLPEWRRQPGFEALDRFLAAGDAGALRRLQLAERLADLFDQYQVHRADWLDDWARGDDRLRRMPESANAPPIPADQRWQPQLWRALLADLQPGEAESTRPALHRRFLKALNTAAADGPHRAFPRLPERVLVFGSTQLPRQSFEALAALARHTAVLMAVPNPCRYHWADLIEGRELLSAPRRRHALREGRDLAALPLSQMHLHGHPLLAAWGRQSRDFIRQLDAIDETPATREALAFNRVDHFHEDDGATMLAQLQAHIRDLRPLGEGAPPALAADDDSIRFEVAHSAQREVEVLHDRLIEWLAHPPGGPPLAPRDIVVMVPDIERFTPAIRSVFGQYARHDARHIPWGIADLRPRTQQPLLIALDWLLRAPEPRATASELRQLLDVPALARRFGLEAADVAQLATWAEGAGVRWGLDAPHRQQLGVPEGAAFNTWASGLQRMLLGYATGTAEPADAAPYAAIEAFDEVAGLEADRAGALAELLERLGQWWLQARGLRRPAEWAELLRALLAGLFAAQDENERALLAALDSALAQWLSACDSGGFDAPVELAIVREAWLSALDEPSLNDRFRAGGVTFCTLLPMRTIPFEIVCLLGMNDRDYPRRNPGNDFDLMRLPAHSRPGDRLRRDDDRQLMLDALLAARRRLYISWSGRSARDNSEQPPSVLVAQLRDHLDAVWGEKTAEARTTEHPLQPFSPRYWLPAEAKGRPPLRTHAREWRAAHQRPPAVRAALSEASEAAVAADRVAAGDAETGHAAPTRVTFRDLSRFLKNPVREFFRTRLQVAFDEVPGPPPDDEAMTGGGLPGWKWLDGALDDALRALHPSTHAVALQAGAAPDGTSAPQAAALRAATQAVQRLQRAGALPMAGPGEAQRAEIEGALEPMLQAWLEAKARWPEALPAEALRWQSPDAPGWQLEDSLGDRHAAAHGPGHDHDHGHKHGHDHCHHDSDGARDTGWVLLNASRLREKAKTTAKDKGAKEDPESASRRRTPAQDDDAPPAAPRPLRPKPLIDAWLRALAWAAIGQPTPGLLIGPDGVLPVPALAPEAAAETLAALIAARAEGLAGPQPWATEIATGWALLPHDEANDGRSREDRGTPGARGAEAAARRSEAGGASDAEDVAETTAETTAETAAETAAKTTAARARHQRARTVYEGGKGAGGFTGAVEKDDSLARLYPDLDALLAAGAEEASQRLYAPLAAFAEALAPHFVPHPQVDPDAGDDEEPSP